MLSADDPALGTQPLSRALRVSARTVAKLIDSGQLCGFHVPGSRTRRVLRSELLRFMREAKLPDAWIDEAQDAVPAPSHGRRRKPAATEAP